MFSITRKQCANSFRHNCLTMAANIQAAPPPFPRHPPKKQQQPPQPHRQKALTNNNDNDNDNNSNNKNNHNHKTTTTTKQTGKKKHKQQTNKQTQNNNSNMHADIVIKLRACKQADQGFFLVTEERLLGNIEHSDEFVQFLLVCATVISLYT